MKRNGVCFRMLLVMLFATAVSPAFADSGRIGLPEKAFRLTTDELILDATGKIEPYPTYTTQLLNIANRNAQSTRPRNVGQMSDLIQEFDGETYDQWVAWYLKKHPHSIEIATDRTYEMIEKMRQAMAGIDREMVQQWIRELVLTKTYTGLRFQKSILKTIAENEGATYRLANPNEESSGIDGYIGTRAVSVKPVTYLDQPLLQDEIAVDIIFYEKVRGGIDVYYDRKK